MDDELTDWLKTSAGLSGKRLEAAVSQCLQGMVFDLHDLREIHALKQLGELFPAVMVRGKVVAALNGLTNEMVPAEKSTRPAGKSQRYDTKAETRSDGSKPQQATHLPSSKEYAAFISHKKVSSHNCL